VRTKSVIPSMPSRDLDDVLPLYAPLGFDVTYSQERPNPYAAVRRGGIELHFFFVPEFDPADSMGSVVVLVPDTEALHTTFAAGLRTTFGRLPASGVPRMTRPRRRQGALGGVTVVDPGGNWLQISRHRNDEGEPGASQGRLAGVGGRRSPSGRLPRRRVRRDPRTGERARPSRRHAARSAPSLVYLGELRLGTGEREAAAAMLAEVGALDLSGPTAWLSSPILRPRPNRPPTWTPECPGNPERVTAAPTLRPGGVGR
jgi:hypothetical protein